MEEFSYRQFVKMLLTKYRWRTIGILAGFVIGISILCFGFFRTVFVICLSLGGLYVGMKLDDDENLADLAGIVLDKIERFIPDIFRH